MNNYKLAADLQAGIAESEVVAKYRTSKGTVGYVCRDVYRYLNLDVDALGEDRRRELKVRTDGLDAQMVNFLHRSLEQNLTLTSPMLQSVATSFAKKMVSHLDGFVASNGWLEKFVREFCLILRIECTVPCVLCKVVAPTSGGCF